MAVKRFALRPEFRQGPVLRSSFFVLGSFAVSAFFGGNIPFGVNPRLDQKAGQGTGDGGRGSGEAASPLFFISRLKPMVDSVTDPDSDGDDPHLSSSFLILDAPSPFLIHPSSFILVCSTLKKVTTLPPLVVLRKDERLWWGCWTGEKLGAWKPPESSRAIEGLNKDSD